MLPINKHKTGICIEQEIPKLNVYVIGMGNEEGMRNGCRHLITPLGLARQWYSLTRFVVLLDIPARLPFGKSG